MFHRCGEDRICHDVPSCGRNCIGTKDKQRKGDPEQIDGSGGRYRWGSPHDSGREDDNEYIWSKGQLEQGEGHQVEGGHEWEKRECECYWGVGCVGPHLEEWGRHGLLHQCCCHQEWKSLLLWERRELLREEAKIVWLKAEEGLDK